MPEFSEGVTVEYDDETETFTKQEIMASDDTEWLMRSNRDVSEMLEEMRVSNRIYRESGITKIGLTHKMQAYAMVVHWTALRLKQIYKKEEV